MYLWEKNNLLLGSTFESRWNQGYIYYTSTILTEKNSSSEMCNLIENGHSSEKKRFLLDEMAQWNALFLEYDNPGGFFFISGECPC